MKCRGVYGTAKLEAHEAGARLLRVRPDLQIHVQGLFRAPEGLLMGRKTATFDLFATRKRHVATC